MGSDYGGEIVAIQAALSLLQETQITDKKLPKTPYLQQTGSKYWDNWVGSQGSKLGKMIGCTYHLPLQNMVIHFPMQQRTRKIARVFSVSETKKHFVTEINCNQSIMVSPPPMLIHWYFTHIYSLRFY